jgi:aryl-phospho-beta-D-glucosidase BglC (GH1 family)
MRLLVIFFLAAISLHAQAPFHTEAGEIKDASNRIFSMKAVNWWGANGSQYPYSKDHKGSDTHAMPFGIQVQKIEQIATAIKAAGFNTVRLPFSNQMLHDNTKALADWVGPNTGLIGKTPLEVMDSVVKVLSSEGIYVMLNNHSTTTHWCCNYDMNGLWFGKNKHWSQTPKQWIGDWKMLAQRYKDNPYVMAADLRNEVRPQRGRFIPLPQNPNWGRGNRKDWHKAATKAGNEIHSVNPNLLIVVEGINAQTRFFTKLKFPHLLPVIKRPVALKQPNKLVYEVHNYSFSWSRANLARPKKHIRYENLDSLSRMQHYEKYWGFVVNKDFKNVAPVILGEFGCSGTSNNVEPWLRDLTDFIQKKKIGFCWWTLEESLLDNGSYGIMNSTMDRVNADEDWRWKYLGTLLKAK